MLYPILIKTVTYYIHDLILFFLPEEIRVLLLIIEGEREASSKQLGFLNRDLSLTFISLSFVCRCRRKIEREGGCKMLVCCYYIIRYDMKRCDLKSYHNLYWVFGIWVSESLKTVLKFPFHLCCILYSVGLFSIDNF